MRRSRACSRCTRTLSVEAGILDPTGFQARANRLIICWTPNSSSPCSRPVRSPAGCTAQSPRWGTWRRGTSAWAPAIPHGRLGLLPRGPAGQGLGILAQIREPRSCCPTAAKFNALIDAGAGRDLNDSGLILPEEMVDAGMPLRAALMVSVLRLVSESVRPD